MAEAFLKRDYGNVSDYIKRNIGFLTHYYGDNDSLYGYTISENNSLTNIYGFNTYVVKFVFDNIETSHVDKQEKILLGLCNDLKKHFDDNKGYYVIRIPSHILDLNRAFNSVIFNDNRTLFCGGTIEEVQYDEVVKEYEKHREIKLFFADNKFLQDNQERLSSLAADSFNNYHGQYHISNVTSEKASMIYSDWIEKTISGLDKYKVLIAEIDNNIAGFCTVNNINDGYEVVLNLVDSNYRKHHVYKSMISYLSSYAKENGGYLLSSTQFDNFIVQGTWDSLGMRPFYSIYNFHFNNI